MKRIFSFLLVLVMLCSLGAALAQEAPAAEEPAEPAADGTALTSKQLFTTLSGKTFTYASGAGGWYESLTISADGSFTGETHDADYGVTYDCYFSGTFGGGTQAGDYEYSIYVTSLKVSSFSSYTSNGTKHVSTSPRGISNGLSFRVYLPGIKVKSLPTDFRYMGSSAAYVRTTYFTGYGLYASSGGSYAADRTGWESDSDGNWYYYENSSAVTSSWKQIDGSWYYFGSDGKMYADQWQDGYYLTSSGAMASGWVQDSAGSWYYYSTSGVKQTGWTKLSGTWYYLDPDTGAMAADEWVGSYYMKSNGAMATGWVKDGDGNWMLFSSAGKQLTGWQKSGSTWYYLDPDNNGIMATDWCPVGETWYYFGTNGAMRTGWQKIDDVWYYFGTNGAMRTGWQKISSKWYFFDDAGMMQSDCWTTDGYYLTSSGAMATGWAQDPYGEWYLFNSSGKMLTGWQKSGSTWYYLDPEIGNMYYDGVYYIEAEGRCAEFAANGAWIDYVDETAA